MRITQLQINNLFSYKKANIHLECYNVIVGANASGKTNLIRILGFLRSDTATVDDRRLPLDLKFDKNLPSSLRIDILLTKYEAKILLELIFNKKIEDYLFDENLTHISLWLEWTKIYDDYSPPDTVILYFNNHLGISKDGARINITYIRSFPESIEDLKSDINESMVIESDEALKKNYHDKKGFNHSDLFSHNSFQDALLKNGQIKDFFELEDKKLRLTENTFSIMYDPASTNKQKEHVVEIFGFLGKEASSVYSPCLWLLISRYLQSLTIQDETRPNPQDLAKSFVKLKSYDLERYNSINTEFSRLFPNVSFSAQPPENSEQNRGPRIEFREKNPFTGQIYTFDFQNCAAGYGEVMNMLLEKSQETESVLVLDEPALHLHPSVIRHLTRVLDESERQIVLVSHSPYFVDISALGPGRNLLYVKKGRDGSSDVFPNQQGFNRYKSTIKSYIFNPDILFSSYNILIEGASDAATFYAISDSLNSVFERYNIVVVNANGHGHIDPYIEFMTNYQIPYVAMVDSQYNGDNLPSANFVILEDELEDELTAAGWQGQKADPDDAYNFVCDTIQRAQAEKIRNLKLGQVFDKALREIGENPDNIWDVATSM